MPLEGLCLLISSYRKKQKITNLLLFIADINFYLNTSHKFFFKKNCASFNIKEKNITAVRLRQTLIKHL